MLADKELTLTKIWSCDLFCYQNIRETTGMYLIHIAGELVHNLHNNEVMGNRCV